VSGADPDDTLLSVSPILRERPCRAHAAAPPFLAHTLSRPLPSLELQLAAILATIARVATVAQLVPRTAQLAAALRAKLIRLKPGRGGATAVGGVVHEVISAREDRRVVVRPSVHTAEARGRDRARWRGRGLRGINQRLGGDSGSDGRLVAVAAERERGVPVAALSLVEVPNPRVAAVLFGRVVRQALCTAAGGGVVVNTRRAVGLRTSARKLRRPVVRSAIEATVCRG